MHHSLSKVLEGKGVKVDVHMKNARPIVSFFPLQTPAVLDLIIDELAEINDENESPIWSLTPNHRNGVLCFTFTYSGDPSRYGRNLNYLALRLDGDTL